MTFEQVRNVGLSSDLARANLLTNGGFEIWQRGAGPFSGNGLMGTDRWQLNLTSGSTYSLTRDTTHQDVGSGVCAAISHTSAAAGSGLLQYFNGIGECGSFIGRTISFSIRVNTNTAGSVVASIYDNINAYHNSPVNTVTGQYQTLSVTATIPTTATQVVFGITFQSSCTIYVDNAMLVIGAQPADFVGMHPADDLQRCLRYYQRMGSNSAAFASNGYAAAGGYFGIWVTLLAWMPINPTYTKVGTWNAVNCNQPSMGSGNNQHGFQLYVTATALGNVNFYCQDTTTYITAEANP